MPLPESFLTRGLAATSLGAAVGLFRDNTLDAPTPDSPEAIRARQLETLGIGAATTAGIVGLTNWAAARQKNPTLSVLGAALAAGAAYSTTRIYSALESKRMSVEGDENPSLGTRILEGMAGLGSLYYGGRALAPYVSRSVAELDTQFRPWFGAFAETVDQTQLGNLGSFATRFEKTLQQTRNNFSTAAVRYPVQSHLNMIHRVQTELSETDLALTAQRGAVKSLLNKYAIGSNEAVNGLRSATLADALKTGQSIFGLDAVKSAGVDLASISLGKGVLFDTNANKILNLHAFTPGRLVSDAITGFGRHVKLPILNFNPIQLFRPNEFLGALEQGTQFHIFQKGTPIGPNRVAGDKGAAYIGGKLYDIATGQQLDRGGVLLKAGAWKGEKNNRQYFETQFGEILRKRQYEGEYPGKKAPNKTWYQKTLNFFELDLPFIHKTGFAENPSRWDKLWHPIETKKGSRGILSSIESVIGSTLGTTEYEELKPSSAGKDVFGAAKRRFSKAGIDITTEPAFAYLPYSDMPGTTAFWLANRPTRLLEDLGLGNFNPSSTRSASDVVWKMFFKRFLPLYASYKLVTATNDLTRATFGYGPSDVASDALAGFNIGSAYLRDVLGITDMAKYMEELMPGITSTSGPAMARGFGLPLVLGAHSGRFGFGAGAILSAFLGGASTRALTMTGEETYQEYFGYRRAPVRSGRWWMFGSTPFEGGKVKYFAPNWYKQSKAHAQFTDVQYGSEFEFYSNYMDPYHYAIKHYFDRPYPMYTSTAQELPFIGPMVGGLFAPPMMMHTDYLYGGGNSAGTTQGIGSGGVGSNGPGGSGGSGSGGGSAFPQAFGQGYVAGVPEQPAPYGVAAGLGGLPPPLAVSPDSLSSRAGEQIYRATEYLGIYGFMVNSLNANLTGNQDFFTSPQLESASRIDSSERDYWDRNIGDPFGTTELFRRFLPHRRRQIDLINPIPNNSMPGWMPGNEYFIDYHTGDPYSKIELGESRLPGAGYEKYYTPGAGVTDAARQLGMANLGATAGQYSNYSMMDVYRILGNTANYSPQFKYAKEYIMAMSKAGMLTPQADEERKYLKKELTLQKKRYNFRPRTFTSGGTANETITVDQYLGGGKFTVAGKEGEIYDLAGLKGITPAGDKAIQETIFPGAEITVQTLDDERYKKKTNTVVPTTPVVVGSLNRTLIGRGMAEYKKTGPSDLFSPLNHKVKYDVLERGIGTLWENFSHLDTPLHTKFLHNRSAIEEWERTQLYGRDSADWTHPIRDFLMPIRDKISAMGPIGGALVGGIVGSLFGASKVAKVAMGGMGVVAGGMAAAAKWGAAIPEYRQKEWDVEQYYDILEYLKYQRLYAYTRNLAIEKEGIDPGKVMSSVEASQRARKAIREAIGSRYGNLSMQQSLAGEDKDAKASIKAKKQSLKAGLEFLSRQKWTEDAALSALNGTYAGAALRFHEKYMSTMYGADPNGDFASIMRALPTKQREFFNSFMMAPADERERIKSEVPIGMRRFLEAKWGEQVERNPDLEDYFQNHYLPGESWVGWHPAVNLDDVKLKTVQSEAMDIHDFNMWDPQVQELKRKPYVPAIDPFSSKGNPSLIMQEIRDIMTGKGYNNYELYITQAAGGPEMELDFEIKYATDPEARKYINKNLPGMLAGAYVS